MSKAISVVYQSLYELQASFGVLLDSSSSHIMGDYFNNKVCQNNALERSVIVRTSIALSSASAPDVADLLLCAGRG